MNKVSAKTIYDQFNVSHINIGTGTDITIKMLAELICKTVDFKGRLKFDTNQPDGTPRKLLNLSKANQLGWKPRIVLKDGIRDTVKNFISTL